jgi:hypothetical protein
MSKGFHYMGKCYVWHKKELYRLPFESNLKFYGVKKCAKWNDGYYLGSHRKSLSQLQSMTVDVDELINIVEDKDCPF